MLIPVNTPVIHYKYNNVNTFDVPFPFYGLSSVRVRIGVSTTNKSPVNLEYGTEYYAVGTPLENFENTETYPFGTIILTATGAAKLHPGQDIAIYRSTPHSQEFPYNELDNFPAKSHENALGKITTQLQELSEQITRAIKVDITSEEAAVSAEDMYLVFQVYVEQAIEAVKNAEILVAQAERAASDASSAAQAIIDAGLTLEAPLTDSLDLQDSQIGASAKAAYDLNQKIEAGSGALSEPRNIALTGGATGNVWFDGKQNVQLPVTALDVSVANAGILATARGGTGNTTNTSADSNRWQGAQKYISTSQPSGGADGDIWFQIS